MPYTRVKFIDPAPGGLGVYSWPVNYTEEEEFGRARNIERTATTNLMGGVKQQGDEGPMVHRVTGTILHAGQHQAFINFYNVCHHHTVVYEDFEGHQYEVLITAYKPTRQRTLRNPRDPSIDKHFYRYTVEMEVVRVISGPWIGTPT